MVYFCEDGSMRMGACGLEHADGSMHMGACGLEQSIFNKIDDIQFFSFAWNEEQGSNYLLYYLLTDKIFV